MARPRALLLRGQPAWAALALLALAAHLRPSSPFRCGHAGMCSHGKLQPFVGDISTSGGLQQAAAARSHNKEIVLILAQANRVLDARLFIGNLARLGMEHVLVLGDTKETCAIVAPLVPHVGCVWDTVPIPTLTSTLRAWNIRYRTLARLVRMSYNVLMTDTDTVWFDDPYRYFKAPPLSNFTVINQAELLTMEYEYTSRNNGNGGVLYVQNARPDGVAAWMLAEASDRYLRWADDGFKLIRSKRMTVQACAMDQDCLNDALASVAVGRVTSPNSAEAYTEAGAPRVVAPSAVAQVASQFMSMSVSLPKFMHPAADGQGSTTLRYLSMVMPHTAGQWPEEWGGKWYPDKRGALSSAFQELLKNDCDNCPMWPDVEDPSTLAAAQSVPTELYLRAPSWLIGTFNVRGRTGAWLPDNEGNVAQVIGHAHYMPHANLVTKLVFRQLYNQGYDWPLAEQHWDSQYVYMANMQQGPSMTDPTPFIEAKPRLPRLLVLHPRLRLHKLKSLEQFVTLIKNALEVAELSNRTLVWPDVPCNTSWVGKVDPATGAFTGHAVELWYPYGARRDAMRCLFMRYVFPKCTVRHRGMLPMEYEHYAARFGVEVDIHPGRSNTAFVPTQGEMHASLDTANDPASVVVEVPREEALAHMKSMADAQVVFMAHPVKVAGASGTGGSTTPTTATPLMPTEQCLDTFDLEAVRSAVGGLWSNGAAPKPPLPGRMVQGRLTAAAAAGGLPRSGGMGVVAVGAGDKGSVRVAGG